VLGKRGFLCDEGFLGRKKAASFFIYFMRIAINNKEKLNENNRK